ncbi:helix-turn-helix domain-containing protein [Microbacterium sp. KNMS]
MTKRSTAEQAAQDVASRIEELRGVAERSVAWLSEKTGIPYKTLRRRLYGDPTLFSLAELSAIARALDVELEDILAPRPAKAVAA